MYLSATNFSGNYTTVAMKHVQIPCMQLCAVIWKIGEAKILSSYEPGADKAIFVLWASTVTTEVLLLHTSVGPDIPAY